MTDVYLSCPKCGHVFKTTQELIDNYLNSSDFDPEHLYECENCKETTLFLEMLDNRIEMKIPTNTDTHIVSNTTKIVKSNGDMEFNINKNYNSCNKNKVNKNYNVCNKNKGILSIFDWELIRYVFFPEFMRFRNPFARCIHKTGCLYYYCYLLSIIGIGLLKLNRSIFIDSQYDPLDEINWIVISSLYSVYFVLEYLAQLIGNKNIDD